MTRLLRFSTRALAWLGTGQGLWMALQLAWYGVAPISGGAETEVATGNALTVKRWARDIWAVMPRTIFWGKFMREDQDAIIEVKRDLEGQPGDQITFGLSPKLSGSGVTDDNQLEGQEEALNLYSDSVTLSQLRNGVLLKGRLSQRRTQFDQKDLARRHLKTWLAETIDDDVFVQFDSSPSTIVYGGGRTALSGITTSDIMIPNILDRAVGKAEKADPKIWPVNYEGGQWFVGVLHTDSAYDFANYTTEPSWHVTTQQAGPRTDRNNIFTGMLGTWRGIVLHKHEKVAVGTDAGAGSNLPYASNMFLGRQAGVFAWGARPEAWEKEFDYGAKLGFAIGAIWDMTKAVFNSVDHAFIAMRTYRTNL